MPSPRYAPAREDGTKPYVVTIRNAFAREDTYRLVYVKQRSAARYAAIGREQHTYFVDLRRASPEDVTNLKEYR
jgi:hypothetical protein